MKKPSFIVYAIFLALAPSMALAANSASLSSARIEPISLDAPLFDGPAAAAAALPTMVPGLISIGPHVSSNLPCWSCAGNSESLGIPTPKTLIATSVPSVDYSVTFQNNSYTGPVKITFLLVQGLTTLASGTISTTLTPGIWLVNFQRARASTTHGPAMAILTVNYSSQSMPWTAPVYFQ